MSAATRRAPRPTVPTAKPNAAVRPSVGARSPANSCVSSSGADRPKRSTAIARMAPAAATRKIMTRRSSGSAESSDLVKRPKSPVGAYSDSTTARARIVAVAGSPSIQWPWGAEREASWAVALAQPSSASAGALRFNSAERPGNILKATTVAGNHPLLTAASNPASMPSKAAGAAPNFSATQYDRSALTGVSSDTSGTIDRRTRSPNRRHRLRSERTAATSSAIAAPAAAS